MHGKKFNMNNYAVPVVQFLYRANKGRVYFVRDLGDADVLCKLFDCSYLSHESFGGYQILLV